MGKFINGIACMLLFVVCTNAQPAASFEDTAYIRVVTERAAKITTSLALSPVKSGKVTTVIGNQYRKLNGIHEQHKALIASQKLKPVAKEEMAATIQQLEDQRDNLLKIQHIAYLNELATLLNPSQVEQVKNGMTYNVLNVTYKGYQDMIPTLKAEEKEKIYNWLVEARELAMDAESSDKKHAVFGKYKGRINNYLSAQGYDSQKERAAWEARIKATKDAAKSSN